MPKHEIKKLFCCISSNSRAETQVDKIFLEANFNPRIMQKSEVVTSVRSLFIF